MPEGRGGQDARERPGSDATLHFVEKWLQREPEMRIAAAFCARADGEGDAALARMRFEAWGALLHELREALFEIPDAGVASAKRGWWAEELQLIASRKARHPLGEALQSLPQSRNAAWTGLSLPLMGGAGEARAGDTAQALGALLPLARAAVAVENTVFHARDDGDDAARALAVHWLLQRLPRGLSGEDGARVPMHLMARHGLTAAQLPAAPDAFLRDWAAELLASLPPSGAGAFLRRARRRFDRARLQRLAGAGGQGGFDDPGALPTLWRAWQAARGG